MIYLEFDKSIVMWSLKVVAVSVVYNAKLDNSALHIIQNSYWVCRTKQESLVDKY